MNPIVTIRWDVDEVAAALGISREHVNEMFNDGRQVSWLLNRRLARVLNMHLVPTDGGGVKLVGRKGDTWILRCITDDAKFVPSSMLGTGRHFDAMGFDAHLANLTGFIVADLKSFPAVPCWDVCADTIGNWHAAKLLSGTKAGIKRFPLLSLLEKL
jgi:hypothetical protein